MITLFRSVFSPPRHLILLLIALWIGQSLSEKRAEKHGVPKETLNNLVYYGILGYVLGGRLLFVLANIPAFVESPLSIFSVNVDLFDPAGAVVTAILVGFVYGQRVKLPFWPTLDALTPLFAVLAIGLSLSHLAAGTAFGRPTDLPWGMELWNTTRHPSQLYELISSILAFVMIWFRKANSPTGMDFLLFTSFTAGARLFLEAFRGDSTLLFGGVRLAQLVAWVVLAVALWASESIRHKQHSIEQNPPPV